MRSSDSGLAERRREPSSRCRGPEPTHWPAGAEFDVVASKLRPPAVRAGTIRRPSLTGRLAHDDSRPVVSVVAPAGYGKTTLLSHWAENSSQAFAWVSVDEEDNDPRVLLSYVARALDAVQPVGSQVFEALAAPVCAVPRLVVPRLGAAFWSMTVPVVLVPGPSALTGAELRVLPMLTTHLSFPEIGAELFLSPHTVKSQAISIYRKLGASSRNEAVARSRELGLLDA